MLADHVRERFRARVLEGANDECWPWCGGTTADGYGILSPGRRGASPLRAHRISFELHYGPIPEGLDVLHDCDNRRCCNPFHIYVGTNAQNVADKVRRGRQSRVGLPGSQNPNSNLNERVVQEIKTMLQKDGSRATSRVIRERYNISRSVLSAIRTGRTWQSVKLGSGDETEA